MTASQMTGPGFSAVMTLIMAAGVCFVLSVFLIVEGRRMSAGWFRKLLMASGVLALGLVPVLLSSVVLEVVVRATGVGSWRAPVWQEDVNSGAFVEVSKEGFVYWDYRSVHGFDAEGYREGYVEPDPNSLRVVVLGDSTTYGVWGDFAQSYPQVLFRLLEESGKRVQNYNLAVPSYGIYQENISFERKGKQVSPHLVLVGVGDHDASPNGNVLPVARIATVDGEITADGLTNLQRLHGHFWSGLISYQWLFQEYLFRYGSGFDGYSGLFAWRDWYILHGLDELEQLHHSVLDAGAQLVLVMLPDDLPGRNSEIIPREAPFPYEPQHFCSYARQWAADNGVPVLEPARAVRRFDYDEVMLDSMHFNNRGHKIVGDYLFDELVARKLIPAGRY